MPHTDAVGIAELLIFKCCLHVLNHFNAFSFPTIPALEIHVYGKQYASEALDRRSNAFSRIDVGLGKRPEGYEEGALHRTLVAVNKIMEAFLVLCRLQYDGMRSETREVSDLFAEVGRMPRIPKPVLLQDAHRCHVVNDVSSLKARILPQCCHVGRAAAEFHDLVEIVDYGALRRAL